MPLQPTFLKPVADAIGDALTTEELQDIVKTATGSGLFEEYAAPNDPRRLAVRRTLERLIQEGTERWLLTYVLIGAVANESLRRLIVKACPETLMALPNVDQQVDRAVQSLTQVMRTVLTPELRHALRPSRSKISDISHQIARLSAYKVLHECLHALHLKLAFRSVLDSGVGDQAKLQELADCQKGIEQSCATGREAATPLGADAQVENAWIAELERSSATMKEAIAASNAAQAASVLPQVQRLIRLHLSRLNMNIFKAATKLSLDELMAVLPSEATLEDSFIQLSHAIRDLKVTVIARALVHKFWQDAENELSLIEEFFGVPASAASQFVEQWLVLRSRVLWLASLDPDADWSKQAMKCSEHIDDELTDEKLADVVKPLFDAYRRLLKFRFFAIDAALKADCGSLGKFHAPLKQFVEEIGHA